jgi:NADH-quinone oxidoreductase subunit K
VTEIFWNVSTGHFLALSAVLLAIGVVGAIMRRNALIVLMSVELMLNAGNLAILAFARQRHDMKGHALAMIVIALAAAEAAIGLAIVVGVFRATRHANVDRLTTLKN